VQKQMEMHCKNL